MRCLSGSKVWLRNQAARVYAPVDPMVSLQHHATRQLPWAKSPRHDAGGGIVAMSLSKQTNGLSFREWIEGRADLVSALPDDEFLREEVSEELQDKVDSLRTNNVLERVDSVRREAERAVDEDDHESGTCFYTLAVFEVNDRAREIAEGVVENRDPMCPCGHAGFRNRGDHFECAADFCTREFDRDELEVA